MQNEVYNSFKRMQNILTFYAYNESFVIYCSIKFSPECIACNFQVHVYALFFETLVYGFL